MATIRTFIALDIGNGIRHRLISLQEELTAAGTGVKWVPLENFHLTLLFLGDVPTLDTIKICREVKRRAKKHDPFTLAVGGVGGFPNSRRPKILWAGLSEGLNELVALHADLEEGLLDLGCYRREERAYTPHLTLGRLTQEGDAEAWGNVLKANEEWHGGEMSVNEVLVMSSEMRRSGPEYSVIGRANLG